MSLRSSRGSLRGRLLTVALATLTTVLAGCVSLPEQGRVQRGPDQDQAEQSDAPFDFNPSGPRVGATPVDIVDGFLLAMQASPQSTAVARQFLTDEANSGWVPERSTLVYGSHILTETAGSVVTTEFEETVELDSRGRWLGDTSGGGGVTFRLDLVREKGEWRISNPPDALVVPQSHFETRFDQYFLYYFDPTAQVLVPQPVYLPRGEQAPTLLVRRLLAGPDEKLLGVLRNFIPPKTELDLSVPVSADGTADVPLSGEFLELTPDDRQLALAQIGWTLRQVSGIEKMRVTVNGSPIAIPGEGSEQGVQAWTQYDPAIYWASRELFGLRGGRVVVLSGEGERRIEGPFGAAARDLRSIAVDLPGERVAAVSEDGATVFLAPLGRLRGEDREDLVVYDQGTDVLKPAWDVHGHLWVLDRTARGGARLTVIRSGVASSLEVPGITGENVKAFLVSRDGTRLVAVVDGLRSDRLVVARILRRADGRVRRLTAAEPLPVGEVAVEHIRDIAWRSPGSVAVLTGPTPTSSQVTVALIDGSSALGGPETTAQVFREKAVHVVTSPVADSPLYVGTAGGNLFELVSDGQWSGTSVKGGLRSPTFVG